MAEKDKELIEDIEKQEYKYGFTSDIETETIPRGLNEEVVRLISTKKGEPEWMTERRLKAYRHWLNMVPPTWAHLTIPPIDFQDVIYYAAPKPSKKLASMDEVDPELKRTFDKAGYSTRGTDGAGGCRRRCRDGLRIGQNDLQGDAGRKGNHLLFDVRGDSGLSRVDSEISGKRGPLYR